MTEWIQRALSETNGSPSSLRVSFLLWELVLVISFVAVIAYALLSHWHRPDAAFNPVGPLGSILAFLGANRASKAIQKSQENNSPTPPATGQDAAQ